MEYLVLAFVCKLAAEVVFKIAKESYKRYKAAKKPGVDAPDQS